MNLYLMPIETAGIYRGPRYLRWRFNDQGLNHPWSLKDFGHRSGIALIGTTAQIERPDVLRLPVTWSRVERDRVGGTLRAAGIEHQWVSQAEDWREAIQRMAGLALAMQSAEDDPFSTLTHQDPAAWMGRVVAFGAVSLLPLDLEQYAREQETIRQRIIEPLRVQWERERPRFDWRLMLKRMALMPLSLLMGALPATDAFTTGSDQALTSYSASWTNNSNSYSVVAATDDVYQSSGGSNGGEGAAHWNADTFDNAQYSSIKQNAVTSGNFRGPAVRCAASAATYYGVYGDNNDHYLFKMVSGTWTQIGSTDGTNGAVNDVLRLEVNGTTLTPKRNGSNLSMGAQTDSSISSGYAGICGYGTSTSARLDDWEGGNISSTTAKSGSDTVGVSATEGTTSIAASSTRTDTTSVSLSEAAAIGATSTQTDTISVGLDEAAAIAVTLSQTDTTSVSLSEAAAIAATSTQTDAADVSLGDGVEIQAGFSASDSVGVGIDESALISVPVSVSDTIGIGFSETTQIDSNPGGSESLGVSFTESASILVIVAVTDTLSVVLDDASALDLVPISGSDTLGVEFSEDSPQIAVSLVRADVADLSLGESASIFVTFSTFDTMAVDLSDAVDIALPAQSTDLVEIQFDESATVAMENAVTGLHIPRRERPTLADWDEPLNGIIPQRRHRKIG